MINQVHIASCFTTSSPFLQKKGARPLLLAFVFFLLNPSSSFSQTLQVDNLTCEDKAYGDGIDQLQPRLSWQLKSAQKNVLQTAYRILVADDENLLKKNIGNCWDSKKVNSDASILVNYAGKPLLSAKRYYWKVMVWDNKANVSPWSDSYAWQMGLLKKEDWKNAQWIGYDEVVDSLKIAPLVHLNGKKSWGPRRNVLPMLRKEFSVSKKIKSATAFICGLGHFELFINGEKTGDHFLDPGWTDYSKHAQYVTFDITKQITEGKNAIGVMLGNGFYYIPGQRYRKMTGAYGHPKMMMRTLIEYEDGSIENIISDASWKTAPSPIIFSSLFGGEDYDANLEQTGWNQPGFDDRNWKQVIITTGPPQLEAQTQYPVTTAEEFFPKTKKKLSSRVTLYDFRQNFSGIPVIKVRGNKGDTVRIYCAELVNKDSTANQKATGSPSCFTYILKGDSIEQWFPYFSYTGFRYTEVHCIPKDSGSAGPVVESIFAFHTRYAVDQSGEFISSSKLFNQTANLINWAIKSNMVSVFTDCPHREKLGWLEQTHLMGASVHYAYHIAALNRKMIRDMMMAQHPDGRIPEIAPEFTAFTPPFDESPEWGSASIILPWYNYQWYGDKETLFEAYPMMQRYMDYLLTKDSAFILKHGLGDWFDIGPKKSGFAQMTKMGITATATFYYNATIMAKIAAMMKKQEEVKKYAMLAADIKTAFNKAFFDKQKLQYDSASQTANAMALYMDLVEPKYKTAVLNALIRDIENRDYALTAGDIGFRYVIRALEENGRSDIIFKMNNRDDVPGYGYQIKHGATALTESWQAYESVSNNHFMLGHLMEWFYSGLAGIRQAPGSAGYKKVEIRPQILPEIKSSRAITSTPYGYLRVSWERTAEKDYFTVIIPPNTTATVYLPLAKGATVEEQDKSNLKMMYKNGECIIQLGSGSYFFRTEFK